MRAQLLCACVCVRASELVVAVVAVMVVVAAVAAVAVTLKHAHRSLCPLTIILERGLLSKLLLLLQHSGRTRA